MKTFFGLASLALASGQESLQDEVPSLLQLRALHDQNIAHNLTSSPKSGHSFGCTGRETAVNVVQCGLWGDVHQHMSFQGNGHPDTYGTGWFWLAKSQDGEFQAQGFYRQSNLNHRSWTTLSHFAFKFGPDILFMDRVLDFNEHNAWMWKYYWNGVERPYTDAPDINPIDGKVTWVNRGSGSMSNTAAHGLNFGNIMQAYDARRHNCFEYKDVAVWVSFQNWQNPRGPHGPYGQCGIIEIEGKQEYLDTGFGQCAKSQTRVAVEDLLVTTAQSQKVCTDDRLTDQWCTHPPEDQSPFQPSAEDLCNDNNFPFANAQALCDGQLQAHGQDIYDGCVFDVCASADDNAKQNAVQGAELEAAMGNSRATCLLKPFGGTPDCKPCNICWDAIAVDLTQITCNNLGGMGPDTGCPAEIRYKNAINLNRGAGNGVAANDEFVDVVLTVVGSYDTPKPEKNGNTKEGQFGRFTVATNSNSNFKFSFERSSNGEAVSIPDIALTFYDLDEANNKLQRETVSSCEISEAYVTEDTELEETINGNCVSLQSTVKGTGQDNPQSPDTLSMSQAARALTFEFHARASISFTAAITGDRYWPRPIVFSFLPQVACGASDSQVQCDATRPQ